MFFQAINVDEIEFVSFFYKDGKFQGLRGDLLKRDQIQNLQNLLFTFVNLRGGRHTIIYANHVLNEGQC